MRYLLIGLAMLSVLAAGPALAEEMTLCGTVVGGQNAGSGAAVVRAALLPGATATIDQISAHNGNLGGCTTVPVYAPLCYLTKGATIPMPSSAAAEDTVSAPVVGCQAQHIMGILTVTPGVGCSHGVGQVCITYHMP
jgi:hypothetical protein